MANWNHIDTLTVLRSSREDLVIRTAAAMVLAEDEREAWKGVG